MAVRDGELERGMPQGTGTMPCLFSIIDKHGLIKASIKYIYDEGTTLKLGESVCKTEPATGILPSYW